MPKVSVVIATRNRVEFLKDAVESVIHQTFRDWEIVLVDNGSTDGTRKLVEHYIRSGVNVRYLYLKTPNLQRSRGLGVLRAQGDYISTLDDDDLYLPHNLEKHVAYLESHPEIDMVYSHVNWVDSYKRHLHVHPDRPAHTLKQMLVRNPVSTNAVMIRKKCFMKLGVFDTSITSCDDYEMWLRIARSARFAFLPGSAGLYRIHAKSMSRDHMKRYRNLLRVYHIINETLPQKMRAFVKLRMSRYSYAKAVEALDAREYRLAAKFFLDAVSFNPLIGLSIRWSRFKNFAYRVAKPYMAAAACFLMSAVSRFNTVKAAKGGSLGY